MRIFTRSYPFLLLFLLLAHLGFAELKHGGVAGVVRTSEGKPAAYVSVTLVEANKGGMTTEDGSFQIRGVEEGTYTLRVSYVGLQTQEKTVTVTGGQITRVDFTLAESAAQLSEVVVAGYAGLSKPVAFGKADIRPLDLPQSVGIVNSTVIADQQVLRLGDAIRNVSGVSLTQQRQGIAETFTSRGFSIGIGGSGGSIFKNGVISNTQGFPDASTLESIEVLKGSAALLYGNVSGGLVINMVTKKPKFDWGGEVSMRVGSYDLYKPTIDVYGPISKNLAFRVVGTYEKANSFRDVVNSERVYVNPSLVYKLGQKTEILVQADYLKSDLVPDNGIGALNGGQEAVIPDIPRSRFINAVWAYNNTEQLSGSVTVNHRFNDQWKINLIASTQKTQVDGYGLGVPNNVAGNGDFTRTLSAAKTSELNYTTQLNLNGNVSTGFLHHQLLVGADVVKIESESNTFKFTAANGAVGTGYDKINILDPAKFEARTDVPTRAVVEQTTSPNYRFGAYVQDMITVSDKFKVLAGLRWSYQNVYRTTIFNNETQQEREGANPSKADRAFSPKAALIYQPVQNMSFYASYANNFTVNSGTDINFQQLDPSIVDQYEVGAKSEFLNGKLTTSLSVYRYVNSNLAQQAQFRADGTSNTDPNVKELTGETTSDGFDIDIKGNVSQNFYFLVGYGYNYHRFTNTSELGTSMVEGERLINNPAHTANGSVFYTFDQSFLKGIKLGVSAFYTGERNGGLNNTVDQKAKSFSRLIPLSGFTTLDLSAGYSFRKVSLLAKISNITNELNYVVHDRYSINPIAPRQFMATVGYKF
ncbi:TonB-dependent receptor [Rufibacter quisquiliarum]|uniref:Iron complex outermembrane receptor protein n=1 Tax=Rufibacter quisquiliarum TaxID=1549639 RepID=A0A839GPK6_9BACT|nr:TonB-dependent receptor [Rufibacter quisquiliarum]MBA9076827.1 iron complex outermembrane receptor protein [Rufibacter quisquiliarum]